MTWAGLTWTSWPPLLIALSSLVPGVAIFFLAEERTRLRVALNLGGAVLVPDGAELRLPAVLLGTTLALDTMGRLFLGASALVWLAAGAHGRLAREHARSAAEVRRTVFLLLTQAGSLGALAVAEPMPFYLFFAVTTVAAFGMIAAGATPAARAAGRLYLTVAPFGELLTLAAFMLFTAGQAAGLAAGLAAAAGAPGGWAAMALAVVFFALLHAVAKAALVLGVDAGRRCPWRRCRPPAARSPRRGWRRRRPPCPSPGRRSCTSRCR